MLMPSYTGQSEDDRLAHFAGFCDPSPSHVMAIGAIGRGLKKRGHRVTLFHIPGFESLAQAQDLDFIALPLDSKRHWTLHERLRRVRKPGGLTIAETIEDMNQRTEVVCEAAPALLLGAQVDALLVDQVIPAASSVAERLGLPFFSICNSLPLNRDPNYPPWFLPFRFRDNALGRFRNRSFYALYDLLSRPIAKKLNSYRQAWGLMPFRIVEESFSRLAQISQLIPELEYPRRQPLHNMHFVGPYQRTALTEADFPYKRLDGRPMIYAAMGTLHGSYRTLWRVIAESCLGLGAQLVISLGGSGAPEDFQDLPGEPVVVGCAPQQAVLARSTLFIHHGSVNSSMEGVAAGVPMVTIPFAADQFGMAARLVHAGVSAVLPAKRCEVRRLRPMIAHSLQDQSMLTRAKELMARVAATGGAQEAAQIIDDALGRHRNKVVWH
jgi:UDP:flavonoid glycosyltransferase YjiC (YdhE family)